jgi:signal transduction histidine kinase/ActR/RegA family two-component response regulator
MARNTATVSEPRPATLNEQGRLLVLEGPLVGQKFTVGDSLVIGRALDAEAMIADGSISRKHARVCRSALGSFVLEDLGSKNGTRINGIPIARQVLKYGDRIQLGARVVLVFNRFDSMEDKLLQRQRLETMGRMVAGVTHDLNNLIGAIVSSVDYLDSATGPLDTRDLGECIADIRLAAMKAGDLTASMLAFARGERAPSGLVDLSQVCFETMRLIRHSFDRTVNIETDIQPNLYVAGNYSEVHQALMNLCMNAGDAMPGGGCLRIEAKTIRIDELPVSQVGQRKPDRPFVMVSVSDTGTGMAGETLARAFEPFFSTKGDGKGFGLGLATVKEIVSLHGGDIQVKSAIGEGTIFTLYLPAAAPEDRTRPRADTIHSGVPRADRVDTILVVDDEPLVRRSLTRILVQAGYHVVQATDGEAAIRAAVDDPGPDLILLDQDMPNLTGEQTQLRLKQIAPLIPVVFGSGRIDPDTAVRVLAQGAAGFLQKPYTRDMLLSAIALALESSRLPDEERSRPWSFASEGALERG